MTSAYQHAIPKILIVGSGPSGLVLALSLRRNGIHVCVIEKSMEHRIGQRGAGIMPRSLELFEALGVYKQVESRALGIMPTIRTYKMPEGVEVLKEIPISWEEPTPSIPYNNILLLGQDNLDKILRAELQKYDCEVELGVELQSLEQSDTQVKVNLLKYDVGNDGKKNPISNEERHYDWVIGADGAKGTVRRALGLKLLGETITERFVAGDLEAEGLDINRAHMWGNMANIGTMIRGTENKGVFTFFIGGSKMDNPEEICISNESVVEYLMKSIGQRSDIKIKKMLWASPYQVNVRMAETFRSGRVFIVGDAAHVHSPAGGQGMNTGIQDSFNLAWKLALVVKGISAPTLLDTFNEERLPVVSQMLEISTGLFKKTIANNDESGWDRSGNIKQLGINYRWSSIVLDEERNTLQENIGHGSAYDPISNAVLSAGDRAPDACDLSTTKLGATRMFQLFNPGKHTVLVFASRAEHQAVIDSLQQYSSDLVQVVLITEPGISVATANTGAMDIITAEDSMRHAHDVYIGWNTTFGIFVIRPDGVIGARLGSAEGIIHYFRIIYANVD